MNVSFIAKARSSFIAVILGDHPQYNYSRSFVGVKKAGSRKYCDISALLNPGVVYEFRGVFLNKRDRYPSDGFYEAIDGNLVEVSEEEALKYSAGGG
jgi:hypothetical protein